MEVTRDTIIGELISEKPESVEILMNFGLGCVGCPASQMETVEEAAMVHSIEVNDLLKALNQ